MVTGNGLAERPGVDRRPGRLDRMIGRQFRQHQFAETIGFLQMRVAGQDEGVDAEATVFIDALGDRIRVADQCRSRTAAHKADAGP
ncbi:hypothetical protein X741_16595 [Mesorhizobium sp. LNHC229A00]|nr:hypothetical protein X741_16595 [Mesorhizobium sp. LNHC229A00]